MLPILTLLFGGASPVESDEPVVLASATISIEQIATAGISVAEIASADCTVSTIASATCTIEAA